MNFEGTFMYLAHHVVFKTTSIWRHLQEDELGSYMFLWLSGTVRHVDRDEGTALWTAYKKVSERLGIDYDYEVPTANWRPQPPDHQNIPFERYVPQSDDYEDEDKQDECDEDDLYDEFGERIFDEESNSEDDWEDYDDNDDDDDDDEGLGAIDSESDIPLVAICQRNAPSKFAHPFENSPADIQCCFCLEGYSEKSKCNLCAWLRPDGKCLLNSCFQWSVCWDFYHYRCFNRWINVEHEDGWVTCPLCKEKICEARDGEGCIMRRQT